ncbi:hypothetical protein [Nocardia sp. NPDC051750]|uniref:hypothetical protein n=1 Tax=Nocardia sp. NPDC051750 TaxID=3364325 RepID=UPI0037ADD387
MSTTTTVTPGEDVRIVHRAQPGRPALLLLLLLLLDDEADDERGGHIEGRDDPAPE